jgi:hypothetical protein
MLFHPSPPSCEVNGHNVLNLLFRWWAFLFSKKFVEGIKDECLEEIFAMAMEVRELQDQK